MLAGDEVYGDDITSGVFDEDEGCSPNCTESHHFPPCSIAEEIAEAEAWERGE